jgi:endonuclease YncB( thermonuclease family)
MQWIAVCAVLAVSHATFAAELRGKVVSIADGDTITVLDVDKVQHKIRLQGIDAPEKKQAFGTKSQELLTEKIAGHDVVIEWKDKDRYGRILGEVMLGRRHINLEMVQEGMAWHYVQYSKSKELASAEQNARQGNRGVWADKDPIPPWEFRKQAKAKSAERQ